jgi:hypothetical protein
MNEARHRLSLLLAFVALGGEACHAIPRSPSLPHLTTASSSSSLSPRRRSAAQPRALDQVRGGAKTTTTTTTDGPPPLQPSFVATILSMAFGPMLLGQVISAAGGRLFGVKVKVKAAAPERWQWCVAACWSANMIAVAAPGRYDGQAAAAQQAKDAVTPRTANLFSPAGWAFAIWGPIFLGEFLMMLLLTAGPVFFTGSTATPDQGGDPFGLFNAKTLANYGRAAAPGWCAGTAAQVLWCGAFRPSVCGPALLWLPSLLLAATGAGLGRAHRALLTLRPPIPDRPLHWTLPPLPPLVNALVRWPIVLHLGWISAASLVNANNWLAKRGTPVGAKTAAAAASVAAALAVAAYVYRTTGDALVGFVVCWALAAVRSDGARAARGVVPDRALARVNAVVAAGVAVAFLSLLLKLSKLNCGHL